MVFEVKVSKRDGNQVFGIIVERWEKLEDALRRVQEFGKEYYVEAEKVIYQKKDEGMSKFRALMWIGNDYVVSVEMEDERKIEEFDYIAQGIADEVQEFD